MQSPYKKVYINEPTTALEQVRLLKDRNLKIESEEFAVKFLSRLNYYNFSNYLLPYKNKMGFYETNLSFEDFVQIITLDDRLRMSFLYMINILEKELKRKIVVAMLDCYGKDGLAYQNIENYFNKKKYKRFMYNLEISLNNKQRNSIIKHYHHKYGGIMPIWVVVEFMTWGNINYLFEIIEEKFKLELAGLYGYGKKIFSWVDDIRLFRNHLSHNGRLYLYEIKDIELTKKQEEIRSNKIFDYLLVVKNMIESTEWRKYIVPHLKVNLAYYQDIIKLSNYGFCENWEEVLLTHKREVE